MTDPWPGRTLGRYRIEAEIGRGGMGVVYRGRQLSLNRPVAIKILPPQLAADPQFRERFRQEAQVIAGLTHENIVGVYDVEEVEGQYFIVMELLEGESLRSIRERRRFSPQEVVAVGFSLARALAYAHGRGIVHRDIKSQNVMLTADGRVKLTDFGIARIVGGSSVKTQTGAVLGTPEYMAPEQARNGEVSPQTDLYSLGVLLYELATGRLPFTGADPFSVALKHISEQPVPPRQLDPSIPEGLAAIIQKAMAKDPVERYGSAVELASALDRASQPLAATVVATDTAVTVTGLPLASPTAPTVLTAPPPPPLPPALPSAAPAPEGSTYVGRGLSSSPWTWLAVAAVALLVVVGGFFLFQLRSEVARRAQQLQEQSADAGQSPANSRSSYAPANGSQAPPEGKVFDQPLTVVPSDSSGTPPATGNAGPVTEKPKRQPAAPKTEPVSQPVEVAPAPAPTPVEPPPKKYSLRDADYACRDKVEFHIDPEKADVYIDGQRIGISDDWDGMGRGKPWRAPNGFYTACFKAKGYAQSCVTLILDPDAGEKTCDVSLDLDEID
ncbi:MAG: protein kinase [Thermoanaerobaculia bacterium]